MRIPSELDAVATALEAIGGQVMVVCIHASASFVVKYIV
jgi:hypothetical protein